MGDNSILRWSVTQCTSKDFKVGVTTSIHGSNQVWNFLLREFESEGNVYCCIGLEVIQPSTELQSFKTMISLINRIDVNKTIRIDQFVMYAKGSVKFSVPRLILLKDLLDPSAEFLMDDTLYFETLVPLVPSPFYLAEFADVSPTYLPHLQHVFNLQPQLLDSLRSKDASNIFLISALNALGSIMIFLRFATTKELDEKERTELKFLWNVVEGFRLDLMWLKPHYEAALKAHDYLGSNNNAKRFKLDDGSFRDLFAAIKKLEEGHYVRFVHDLQAVEADLANYDRGGIFNGKGEDDVIGYP